MKFKLKRPTKKQLLIIVASVMLALVVAYAVASWLFWSNYDQNYKARHESLVGRVDQALRSPAESEDERSSKLLELSSVGRDLLDGPSLCTPSPLFAWQTTIPALGAAQDKCRTASSRLTGVANELDKVATYLLLENQLAQIITSASNSANSSIKDGKLSEAAKAWSQAAGDIEDMPKNNDFDSVKLEAVGFATKLSESLQELSVADSDEDEQGFVESRDHVERLYAETEFIKEQSDSSYNRLMGDFAEIWVEARP